jgi:hypothetical protein
MTHWYVALDGDDDGNTGQSQDSPFRHVRYAIGKLETGDTLYLRQGVYAEQLTIRGKTRVTICSMPGEHAVIDGAIEAFRTDAAHMWDPGVVSGEFVSRTAFPAGTDRGAFVLPNRHVRLMTYSRLEDLHAQNETFGPLLAGQGPAGPDVSDQSFPKRPWAYLGPGLHQGRDGLVHVRLRRTHLGQPGVTEYAGSEDATSVPLAVWTAPQPTVTIDDCHTLHLTHLTIRFGGGRTILVKDSDEVLLDHLHVLAGPYALEVGEGSDLTRVTHCRFDGGLPPWSFRSDRKDGYTITAGAPLGPNGLAEQTLKTLVYCHRLSSRTTVENCELVNGHDAQLNGPDSVFRSNWVANLNDDGLFIGETAQRLVITGNVFERCLFVLSVASEDPNSGPLYVHRNLVDLRRPTLGRRPPTVLENITAEEERPVVRLGNFFKSNTPDPDLAVFHNTVVINQSQRAVHNLFRSYDGQSRRRVLNNVFVGIDNGDHVDRPLAYLPAVQDDAESDGNCYWGIDRTPPTRLVVRDRQPGDGSPFNGLDTAYYDSPYFSDSEDEHGTGYEAHGTTKNPRLRRFWGPPHFPLVEDLRLAPGSSAHLRGVELVDPDLRRIDGNPPAGQRPDSGCYPLDAPPLRVGVDGLRVFPSSPVVGPLPPLP